MIILLDAYIDNARSKDSEINNNFYSEEPILSSIIAIGGKIIERLITPSREDIKKYCEIYRVHNSLLSL